LLYVELPTPAERADILRTLTKNTPMAGDVNLDDIAADKRCDGYSGADLAGLIREAAVAALRSVFLAQDAGAAQTTGSILVSRENFDTALSRIAPSVSAFDMKKYEALRREYNK
ncbi:Ribosome biogenesis ATPase rix7, partial [Linderina macrospora]